MDSGLASLRDCVRRALVEDLGSEELQLAADVTTALAVPAGARGTASILAKASGVLAGGAAARLAFELLDPGVSVQGARDDGTPVAPGALVLTVSGLLAALLAAERTALNFMQRLSGIATLTAKFVVAVAGTGARILDTRKTTPGLRWLEKRAVVAGGGVNHRFGLHDQVLLKENHFASARTSGYEAVVRRCVAGQDRPVIAEARTIAEAQAAVRGGAAVVLLDNFAPGPELREAVAAVRAAAAATRAHVEVEASGGVRLDNVRAFAECGVDRISIGALTHSAPALDLSLLTEERR
jgi:nicotinate-nucleotide pyrophosphorylase (carboxylating)